MFEKKQKKVIEELRAELYELRAVLHEKQERILLLGTKCMQQSDRISGLIMVNEELAKYKEMYANELQKRLELAALVRAYEAKETEIGGTNE